MDVGQSVYTFGKIKNGIKLAEEAVDQAALELAEESRKLVVLIKNAFYGYLLERSSKPYPAGGRRSTCPGSLWKSWSGVTC